MRRRIELLGDSLSRFVYAFQIVALVLVLIVVLPLDSIAGVPLAVLFALLMAATAYGLWRSGTDSDGGGHPGTAEDITYDPFADPGQAAKERWEKTVRRLPGGDDERE